MSDTPEPRERRRAVGLTVDGITAAAVALVDEHGLDALSMRKLGTALGCEAMSIYKHVPDKESLLDLMVGACYDETSPAEPTAPWDERIRHTAGELRRVALDHPHLLPRMVTRPPTTPSVLNRIDGLLAAAREAGATDDEAVRWFWLFVNLTSGALLAETTALVQEPSSLIDGEALHDCPVLTELGSSLAACDFGAEYRVSVEVLIERLRR